MDVTKQGQATLSLVKEKGQWKPAKGDIALNTANIQDDGEYACDTARERMGRGDQARPGPEHARRDDHFHNGEQEIETVKLGAPLGDYWNASATGFEGTFLISKSDHDMLAADILPVGKAPVTPAIPLAPTPMPALTGTGAK